MCHSIAPLIYLYIYLPFLHTCRKFKENIWSGFWESFFCQFESQKTIRFSKKWYMTLFEVLILYNRLCLKRKTVSSIFQFLNSFLQFSKIRSYKRKWCLRHSLQRSSHYSTTKYNQKIWSHFSLIYKISKWASCKVSSNTKISVSN